MPMHSHSGGYSSAHRTTFKIESLLCLDKSSFCDGSTPFHDAAKTDDPRILEYIIKVFKMRHEIFRSILPIFKDKLSQSQQQQMKSLKSLKQVLEFTNTSNMTPLLIAAKYGN